MCLVSVFIPRVFFIVGSTVSYLNLAKSLNAVYRLMQGKGEYL